MISSKLLSQNVKNYSYTFRSDKQDNSVISNERPKLLPLIQATYNFLAYPSFPRSSWARPRRSRRRNSWAAAPYPTRRIYPRLSPETYLEVREVTFSKYFVNSYLYSVLVSSSSTCHMRVVFEFAKLSYTLNRIVKKYNCQDKSSEYNTSSFRTPSCSWARTSGAGCAGRRRRRRHCRAERTGGSPR